MYLHVPRKDKMGEVNVIFIMLLKMLAFYKIFRPSFLEPKNPNDHKVDLTSAGDGTGEAPTTKFSIVAAHL